MKKRGQVALEFLSDYGWAIMILLLMIGVLAYFGVLNPDRYLPQRCNTGPEFSCTEFMVVNSGYLSFKIVNNIGQVITDIHVTSASWDKEDLDSCFVPQDMVSQGDIIEIICSFEEGNFPPPGNKMKFSVNLDYRPLSLSYTHPLYAEIYATLQSSEDAVLFFGCTNAAAENYHPEANADDGNCIIYGCTSPEASNYDPSATVNDGSCEYLPFIVSFSVNDISDQTEFYFPEGTSLDFGFVLYDHYPSNNMEAWFTGPLADFGSANIPYSCIPHDDPLNTYSCGGDFNCPSNEPCQFNLEISDIPGLSIGEYSYDIMLTENPGTSEFTSLEFNINFYDPYGCTSESACNYAPLADFDDGSCVFPETYYLDVDGDSFGSDSVESCGWPDCIGLGNNPPCYSNIGGDCDDTTTMVNPLQNENCVDGLDNDCDNFIDFCDSDCQNFQGSELTIDGDFCFLNETSCDDGIDNDLDGLIDLCDSDCNCQGSEMKVGCECFSCEKEPSISGGYDVCIDEHSGTLITFSLKSAGKALANCSGIEFHENLFTNNVYYYPEDLEGDGCSVTILFNEVFKDLKWNEVPFFYKDYDLPSEDLAICGMNFYSINDPECQ